MSNQEFSWNAAPELNTDVDFRALDFIPNSVEIVLLSKTNGLITFADLRDRLSLSAEDVEEAARRLLGLNLIRVRSAPTGPSPSIDLPDTSEVTPETAQRAARIGTTRAGRRVRTAGEVWTTDNLGSIFGRAHLERRSGILRIHSSSGPYKAVFFHEGRVIQVMSHPFDPAECLGRLLQQLGRLSEANVINSLEIRKASSKLQGEALLEMGIISSQDLNRFLEIQLQYKLRDVIAWQQGIWSFTDVEDLTAHVKSVQCSLPRLVFSFYWRNPDFLDIEKVCEGIERRYIGLLDEPFYPVHEIKISDHVDRIWPTVRVSDIDFEKAHVALRLKGAPLYRLIATLKLCGFLEFFDAPRS